MLTSVSGYSSVFSDQAALEVIMMSYSGLRNKQIVELCQRNGINAVGLTGLDGRLVQQTSTAGMQRPVARLIADVSAFMTLAAGDLLMLGVAAGAPRARAGQRVRIEIADLKGQVGAFSANDTLQTKLIDAMRHHLGVRPRGHLVRVRRGRIRRHELRVLVEPLLTVEIGDALVRVDRHEQGPTVRIERILLVPLAQH